MARANSSGTSALTRAVAPSSATVPTIRRRIGASASPQKICVTRRSDHGAIGLAPGRGLQRAQLTRHGSIFLHRPGGCHENAGMGKVG